MPKVSISEAARMAGKSRITIHRHIEKGLVSKEIDETGSPVIDVSELERVYGSLRHDTASDGVAKEPHATAGTSNDSSVLQGETENLRERLSLLTNERERERQTLRETIDDLREDRDRWRAQAERATRLLTDQRPETEQTKRLEAELSELREHREHMSKVIEEQGRRLEELAQKPTRRGWWPWSRSREPST
jgi:DNA repair exonuclease SbcCD ATPase subunit